MFRELSRQEIYQHAEALRAQEIWERSRDFALQVYGQRAHRLEIEQLLTEPDENSISFCLVTEIDEWSVYDDEGLLLNPTSTFLQLHRDELQRVRKKGTLQKNLLEIIRREINSVIPAEEALYHFDLPPSTPFRSVYVDDGALPPSSPPLSSSY